MRMQIRKNPPKRVLRHSTESMNFASWLKLFIFPITPLNSNGLIESINGLIDFAISIFFKIHAL